jgi:hypothetical protein
MRIFQPDSYIVCDFAERRISRFVKKGDPLIQGPEAITADAWEVGWRRKEPRGAPLKRKNVRPPK